MGFKEGLESACLFVQLPRTVSVLKKIRKPYPIMIHSPVPNHALKQMSDFTHLMKPMLEICGL